MHYHLNFECAMRFLYTFLFALFNKLFLANSGDFGEKQSRFSRKQKHYTKTTIFTVQLILLSMIYSVSCNIKAALRVFRAKFLKELMSASVETKV